MARLILAAILVMGLVGCESMGKKTHTVYVDKHVPVYIVPTPPDVKRPELETERLTAEDRADDGKVAKAYTVALRQSLIYSSLLESIVNKYKVLAEKSQEKLRALQVASPGVGPQAASEGDPILKALKQGTPEEVVGKLDEILLYQSITEDFDQIEAAGKKHYEEGYKEE